MSLTPEDITAIGDELDRRLAKFATAGKEATSGDYTITWQKGGLCRTVASDRELPGVVFADPRLLAPEYGLSAEDRAFVKLNCGVDDDGNTTAAFGGGFAQPDSVSRDPLQDKFTPFVYHVTYSANFRDYVLQRDKPVGASEDKFPDVFASRRVTGAEHAEWCRRTAEDWKSRGWIPGQSGYKG